jgi:hypothetical protein
VTITNGLDSSLIVSVANSKNLETAKLLDTSGLAFSMEHSE